MKSRKNNKFEQCYYQTENRIIDKSELDEIVRNNNNKLPNKFSRKLFCIYCNPITGGAILTYRVRGNNFLCKIPSSSHTTDCPYLYDELDDNELKTIYSNYSKTEIGQKQIKNKLDSLFRRRYKIQSLITNKKGVLKEISSSKNDDITFKSSSRIVKRIPEKSLNSYISIEDEGVKLFYGKVKLKLNISHQNPPGGEPYDIFKIKVNNFLEIITSQADYHTVDSYIKEDVEYYIGFVAELKYEELKGYKGKYVPRIINVRTGKRSLILNLDFKVEL